MLTNPYFTIGSIAVLIGAFVLTHHLGYKSGYDERDKIAQIDIGKMQQAQDQYTQQLTDFKESVTNLETKLKEARTAQAVQAKVSTRNVKRALDEHKDYGAVSVPLNIDRVRLEQINRYNCAATGIADCPATSDATLPYLEN